MTIRAQQIFAYDVNGADATAFVAVLDRDKLRRDTGGVTQVSVRLTAAERNVFKDVRDRGIAKMAARIAKANTDVDADPNAPIDLAKPIAGEAP